MGWLDSGGGDGYDMLSPDQQQIVDEISVPTPAPDPSSGGLTEAERFARVLVPGIWGKDSPGPATLDARQTALNVARRILASDWLAVHVAAARRDALLEAEAVKARVLALADEWERLAKAPVPSWNSQPERFQGQADALRDNALELRGAVEQSGVE